MMMRTVTAMAGQSGTYWWKTSTTAQERAMKMPPKMYFSTAPPSPAQLLDPVVERPRPVVERDAHPHEERDGDGEHPQRHPEEGVAPAALDQGLVGRLARR